MRKPFSKFALAAGAALALAFTFSCGEHSGGGGGGSDPIAKDKITGTAQKGPFAKGAKVKIYELDANFEKPKNHSFEGETKDDKGNFEIEITGGKLASRYIVLEVKGKYINEVTGKPSDSEITLNATSNVFEKSDVNVNVLTHLEQEKVLKLAQAGTNFDDAKKQAQGEVLSALGINATVTKNSEDIDIFGASAGDSALLLASIMLQANRTTDEVSSLLADFGKEIKDNGVLSASVRTEVEIGLASIPIASFSGEYCKTSRWGCPTGCCRLYPDEINPDGKTNRQICIEAEDGVYSNATCTGTPVASYTGEYCKSRPGISDCPNDCCRLSNPNEITPEEGLTRKEVCIKYELGVFINSSCR